MMKITATLERAGDGSWTASTYIGEKNLVLGTGDTRDAALNDLSKGVQDFVEYLKDKGEPMPDLYAVEVVTLEVAA